MLKAILKMGRISFIIPIPKGCVVTGYKYAFAGSTVSSHLN